LSIEFPFDYPEGSPKIKFVMSNNNDHDNHEGKRSDGGVSSPIITHPNVDEKTGEVSVPWRTSKKKGSSKSIVQALKSVRELLKYPATDMDPAAAVPVRNERALKLWKSDRVQFDPRSL